MHNLGYDEDEYSKKALSLLTDSNKKGYIKVNHFVSDWNQAFIQSNLQSYLNAHDRRIRNEKLEEKETNFDFFSENEGFKTTYDIAVFTKRINMLYGGEIEV
jgi:hypothetical protein